MRKSLYALIACLLGLLLHLPGTAWANVSLLNGNYFSTFTDVAFSEGMEPRIERVYNSKSPFKGIFGWGWGCDLEVYLNVGADGSLVFHEYGGGAEVSFTPPNENTELMQQNITRLLEIKKFSTPVEEENYRKKLLGNADFRNSEWAKAVKMALVEPRRLPVGTIFSNNRFGHMYVVKTRDGYIRYSDSGRKEEYTDLGRLRRKTDTNDNFIDYTYDDKGQMIKLSDNLGRWISLTYNGQGLVTGSSDSSGRSTEYTYNKLAQLIYSRDIDDNIYKFDYDSRNNLLATRYSDGTSIEVSYYSKAYTDNVKRVKDRDGVITSYAYEQSNPRHTKVKIHLAVEENKPLSESSYEYFTDIKSNGEEFTRKMVSNVDGDITDTEYDENGQPLKIDRNGEVARFAYDPLGHATLKDTPQTKTELEYQPVVNKVSRVRITDKNSGKTEESSFKYDSKGNLITAVSSDNELVQLTYDPRGKIASICSGEKEIAFTYNENSKPVRIDLKGVGEITIAYADDGTIKKVDSPGGEQISLEVTAVFQRLLEIIRPAGVTLSF